MDIINPIVWLQEAAGELLQEMQGPHPQLRARPAVAEELVELAEATYEKVVLAGRLGAFGEEARAVLKLQQALSLLVRMIKLASRVRMPEELIESMKDLRFGIKRVLGAVR